MPTYEYVCTECSQPLEVVQSIHDPALTECPSCGGRLRKVFGNVGVVFKGSGFYRTDSRGKSSAATPPTPKASGSDSSGSGSSSDSGSTSSAAPASSGGGSSSTSTASASSSASSGSSTSSGS